MKLPRRQFLHLATGAAALPAGSRLVWAQPRGSLRLDVGRPDHFGPFSFVDDELSNSAGIIGIGANVLPKQTGTKMVSNR